MVYPWADGKPSGQEKGASAMTINYRANVANRYEANALRGYAKANVRTTVDSVAATAYAYAAALGFVAGLVAWYLV